jgi:hypothetical protein
MRRGELTEFQSEMAEAASVVDCVRSDMEAVKAKLVEEVSILDRSGAEWEFVNGRFQAVKFVIACLEAAGEKLKNVK